VYCETQSMRIVTLLLGAILWATDSSMAADWPMGGRDGTRNPVSPEKGAPTDWEARADGRLPKNILWTARLGSRAIGGPVVAGGLIWIGTNNEHPLDPKVKGDRAVLACFRESDGKFLYQYVSSRLAEPLDFGDWGGGQSQSGSPLVEGDRLWFKNNRSEVVCLDIGSLRKGTGPPTEVWKVDLIKEFGVRPSAHMIPSPDTHGSPAGYKDFLYVHTGNGHGPGVRVAPAPDAPSLVCLRKDSGKLVWKDASPGKGLRYGHYSSPLVVEVGGVHQAIVPQGDGWVRAFDARSGKPLWQFSLVAKSDREDAGERATYGMATPVYSGGRVYVSLGRYPEACHGQGRLCCLDPTRSGNISTHARDDQGKLRANPNSGLVWEFVGAPEGKGFKMGLTLASVAVSNGLVIAADFDGFVHCLDERTGQWHWTEDTKDATFGSPLVADRKVYLGNQSGDMTVLELNNRKNRLARHEFNQSVIAGPVFANGTLYVLTEGTLYAIREK
jgi:outer membrane protein assembly factor BamB